jgi:hypothetical protein
MPPPPAAADVYDDAKAAKAYCANGGLAKSGASCQYNGIISGAELQATASTQCVLCGTAYAGLPDALPAKISGDRNYYQYWINAASLACKGRVVVRSVFKVLKSSDPRQGCAGVYLNQLDDDGPGSNPSPVVRCEIDLPGGKEPEAQRALRTKEGRCFLCTRCSDGGGCPYVVGRWYTDSYTTTLKGCDFDASKGYTPYRASLLVNSGDEVMLAKLEVCNGGSCFNPGSEAAKLKRATRCKKGVC